MAEISCGSTSVTSQISGHIGHIPAMSLRSKIKGFQRTHKEVKLTFSQDGWAARGEPPNHQGYAEYISL